MAPRKDLERIFNQVHCISREQMRKRVGKETFDLTLTSVHHRPPTRLRPTEARPYPTEVARERLNLPTPHGSQTVFSPCQQLERNAVG